jgi:hypothetical protein
MIVVIHVISFVTLLGAWLAVMFWDVDSDPNNELFFPKIILNIVFAWLFFVVAELTLNYLFVFFEYIKEYM